MSDRGEVHTTRSNRLERYSLQTVLGFVTEPRWIIHCVDRCSVSVYGGEVCDHINVVYTSHVEFRKRITITAYRAHIQMTDRIANTDDNKHVGRASSDSCRFAALHRGQLLF